MRFKQNNCWSEVHYTSYLNQITVSPGDPHEKDTEMWMNPVYPECHILLLRAENFFVTEP